MGTTPGAYPLASRSLCIPRDTVRPSVGVGVDTDTENVERLFLHSPGRYFASNELRAILAHVILNYDLKLGGDGSRPTEVYFSLSVLPALGGRVLFKKRREGASAGV